MPISHIMLDLNPGLDDFKTPVFDSNLKMILNKNYLFMTYCMIGSMLSTPLDCFI